MKKITSLLLSILMFFSTVVLAANEYEQVVNNLITIAINESGYLEKQNGDMLYDKAENVGAANYTKYAYDLQSGFYETSMQGQPWCDIFVDWCFMQAFGFEQAKVITYQIPFGSAAVVQSMEYYANNGQLYQEPKVGDQIFFNTSHTGIVYKIENDIIYTVEGNTSNDTGVINDGEGVSLKSYILNSTQISGYGRPNYELIVENIKQKIEQEKRQRFQSVINFKGKYFTLEENLPLFDLRKIAYFFQISCISRQEDNYVTRKI